MSFLEDQLDGLDPALGRVLLAIAEGSAAVAEALRTASVDEVGTSNALGDKQLGADLDADAAVLAALSASGAVEVASSEEQPHDIALGGTGFSVAYDPLDGSSIIGANWAVGSIFGVWPGSGFVGRVGYDQVAAAYTVYGPRTVLILARPSTTGTVDGDESPPTGEPGVCSGNVVQEYRLTAGRWVLVRDGIRIPAQKRVCAPANLKASADNGAYEELVRYWMAERYTLRYSGGMVPDVHHMLAKGGGVFCNPASDSAPAKLRMLYECLPLAFIVEAAGGSSHDGVDSVLLRRLAGHDERSRVCLGSELEVVRCLPAMQDGIVE